MVKRVGILEFDKKLTRLRPINEVFVSRYRQAYRVGKDLGEIIIEKGTNRIVSGNHRVTAMIREFGEGHTAEVVEKVFKDESEVLKLFAAENAGHGNALSGASQHAITQELIKLGVDVKELADIFGVSVKRIEEWGGLTVVVIGNNKKKQIKPVKRGVEPGTEMTEAQYAQHWKADRGVSAVAQANQLIRWINNGWITDHESIASLQKLADLVNGTFAKEVVS